MSRADNWFLALPLDRALGLPAPPPGTRLLHPDDVHLTVAFLGACGRDAALGAFERVRAELGTWLALDVTLGAVEPMGPARHASALAVTLVEGREAAARLVEALRVPACEAAGVPVDPRPPSPHLTVARIGRRASHDERAEALQWARGLRLDGVRAQLRRVVLFRSSPEGERRYAAAAEARLGA